MHRPPHGWFRRLLAGILPLCLTACQAALFGAINAGTPDAGVVAERGIVFEPRHGLALDVYRPRDATAAPVVVFFYGGAWQDGKRAWYRWAGETLARHGVVAVVPDYRKYPQVRLDGFMHDAARAVAWAHAHAPAYGGDPDALFLMGHSAGAHIGALLATDAHWLDAVGLDPSRLRGFIGLAGPYDFLPLREQVYIDLFGSEASEQRRSQPVDFVDGDEPPMLLLQGGEDGTVAPRNARSLADALHAVGEPAQVRMYPGVGHAGLLLALSRPFRGRAPALDDALRFIDAHARSGRAAPAPAP